MTFWLFKSEPDTWGWSDQVARGDAGEEWHGVRNYQARNNMRAMSVGARRMIRVGIACVSGLCGPCCAR